MIKLRYERLFSFGNYENMKIGIEKEVAEDKVGRELASIVDRIKQVHNDILKHDRLNEEIEIILPSIDHLEEMLKEAKRGEKKNIKKAIKEGRADLKKRVDQRDLMEELIRNFEV